MASFYARCGYRQDDLLFMEKWLIPNEAGCPHPQPAQASGGFAGRAHDHLFVDWDQAARALALLRKP